MTCRNVSDATVAALGDDYHHDFANKGVSIPPADLAIPTATFVSPTEPVESNAIPALPTWADIELDREGSRTTLIASSNGQGNRQLPGRS